MPFSHLYIDLSLVAFFVQNPLMIFLKRGWATNGAHHRALE